MIKLLACVILLAAPPVYAAQSGCVGECTNGTGTYYYANGDRYEGEWKDGETDGQGTWYYSNGERYEGEWKLGRMDGQGTYYYANGERYEGEWKNSWRDGQGTWYYSNGERYEGEWKLDRMNGQGTYYFADGDHVKGEWVEGERVNVEICVLSVCFAVPSWIYDVIHYAPVTVGFIAAVLIIWGVQRRYESKHPETLRSVSLLISVTKDSEKLPFSRRLLTAIFWGGVMAIASFLFFSFDVPGMLHPDFTPLSASALVWVIVTVISLLPGGGVFYGDGDFGGGNGGGGNGGG